VIDPVLEQVAEKWPSAAVSGRLTVSAAWRQVAPYSSRHHPSFFWGPLQGLDFAKLNLHLPAEA
jgi:hypothetical protein